VTLRFELDPPIDDRLAGEIVSLWVDVSNAGGAVGFVPPVTEADVQPLATRVLRDIRAGVTHIVLAWKETRLAGLAFLEQRPGPLFAHWATVKRLQVHPDLQGRGHGAALLEEVARIAKADLSLEQLHLTVRGGTGTESLYERHGFVEMSRIPGVIRVAPDDDREEIYLVRLL
jgi:GNAT superfamily N-acetyltransferase